MKIYYQKTMSCPLCGKTIRNTGKTNGSGLYEEEKFRCSKCKEEFLPYEGIQKMYIAHKYAIDIE